MPMGAKLAGRRDMALGGGSGEGIRQKWVEIAEVRVGVCRG